MKSSSRRSKRHNDGPENSPVPEKISIHELVGRKSKDVDYDDPPASRPANSIAIFFVSILFCSAVLYVGIFMICRTDGFISMAEEKMSELVGIPVDIKSAHADLALNLILEGVTTEGVSQKAEPGMLAGRIRLVWSLKSWLKAHRQWIDEVILEDGRVQFSFKKKDGWKPESLAFMGEWISNWGGINLTKVMAEETEKGEESKAEAKADTNRQKKTKELCDYRDNTKIIIRNGSIVWWGQGEVELGSIDGLDLVISPIQVPERSMTHYLLRVDKAQYQGGKTYEKLNLELLQVKDRTIMLDFRVNGAPSRAQETPKSKKLLQRTEKEKPEKKEEAVTFENLDPSKENQWESFIEQIQGGDAE